MLLTRDRQRGAIPLGVCEFWQDPLRGSALPVFHRPLAARVEWKLNMNWQNPDLYLFLSLLAGFAALLAIIYEFIQKSRKRKLPVVEPRRSTVTEKAVAPPSPPKHALRHRRRSTSLRHRPSINFARASRTSRQRSKHAAWINISEHSEERGPRRAEVEMASGHFRKSR